jgi:hypothetical protein
MGQPEGGLDERLLLLLVELARARPLVDLLEDDLSDVGRLREPARALAIEVGADGRQQPSTMIRFVQNQSGPMSADGSSPS